MPRQDNKTYRCRNYRRNSFAEILAENKVLFFGDGADKCREALGNNPNANLCLIL
jgi:hypothetical protein